jgi:hypothetical protein
MKQMTCAEVGGPADCEFKFSGSTAEEMITKEGMPHVMTEHPQMAEDIKKMSSEETTKWMEDFRAKFDATPEMN